MPVTRNALSSWHFSSGALDRLIPPWVVARVEENEPLQEGSRTVLGMRVGPIRFRWIAVHERVQPGVRFVDRSIRGPFREWIHEHSFEEGESNRSTLCDRVTYSLPLAPLSDICFGRKVRQDLASLFAFRHRRTQEDLARIAHFSDRPKRTVVVSGSTGSVGRALCAFMTAGGHKVIRLVRGSGQLRPDEVRWDPRGHWDSSKLEGSDAFVHLAGENIAQGRWTSRRKAMIMESRSKGTKNLCEAILRLSKPPSVVVSASAVGFYGNRNQLEIDESAPAGSGFLADVTRAWEAALAPLESRGIRSVSMRIGIVVSARSGVVGALRVPFLLGAGGRVGSGQQGMSWIHIDDLVAAIHYAIEENSLCGAVNAVAPQPVTQLTFAKALARVLRRPCVVPLPAPIVRLLFGEMGEELLLAGQFVRPTALLRCGFRFGCESIDEALRFEFGKLTQSSDSTRAISTMVESPGSQ